MTSIYDVRIKGYGIQKTFLLLYIKIFSARMYELTAFRHFSLLNMRIYNLVCSARIVECVLS